MVRSIEERREITIMRSEMEIEEEERETRRAEKPGGPGRRGARGTFRRLAERKIGRPRTGAADDGAAVDGMTPVALICFNSFMMETSTLATCRNRPLKRSREASDFSRNNVFASAMACLTRSRSSAAISTKLNCVASVTRRTTLSLSSRAGFKKFT